MVWPITEPTYGTYQWLMLGVAIQMGFPLEPDLMDHDEYQMCNYIVQRGVRMFYNPPIPPAEDGTSFTWSFLNLRKTTKMVDGTIEYDLPTTFGGRVDSVTWTKADGERHVEIVSEHELMSLYGKNSTTPEGQPEYCAVRPKLESGSEDATAAQVWELLVYPEPDAAAAALTGLVIRFRTAPADLSTTNLHPRGNTVHAETIMQACLSVAEQVQTKASGPSHERFMQMLQASISIDMAIVGEANNDSLLPRRPKP